MTAYLDYNIFTSIEDNHYGIDKILKIDNSIKQFPYSSSHIQEVSNITAPNENQRATYIAKRLNTIYTISQGAYLYYDLDKMKMFLQTEHPDTVFDTITEIPFGTSAMKGFMNLLPPTMKDSLRQTLGIDAKYLNNYSPSEVIEQLNKSLVNWGTNDSFLEIIEKAFNSFPDTTQFGLHNRIAGVYELLDLCGYWKDKETPTSNYARLWDSSHAFYASYCNYFISDDKRNRNKAKVVYEIYGIPTKILSSNGG